MKIETTKVRTVTLTDTDVRIALCQYANLPAGSQVKLTARTDGEVYQRIGFKGGRSQR